MFINKPKIQPNRGLIFEENLFSDTGQVYTKGRRRLERIKFPDDILSFIENLLYTVPSV